MMFDLNDFLGEAPELAAALADGIPAHFSKGPWQVPNVYFALGGSKSGTQFHKHQVRPITIPVLTPLCCSSAPAPLYFPLIADPPLSRALSTGGLVHADLWEEKVDALRAK